MADRAGPSGLSAVYWFRSHRVCSEVVHWAVCYKMHAIFLSDIVANKSIAYINARY